MLHAFESYCTRQGGASCLLQNLEKEKELLRIFLKVSQMENAVLRRMNLNSFLMVPVQRVTKYPLLLARLLKATPSVRIDVLEARKRLEQARANIELHLEHMNAVRIFFFVEKIFFILQSNHLNLIIFYFIEIGSQRCDINKTLAQDFNNPEWQKV